MGLSGSEMSFKQGDIVKWKDTTSVSRLSHNRADERYEVLDQSGNNDPLSLILYVKGTDEKSSWMNVYSERGFFAHYFELATD